MHDWIDGAFSLVHSVVRSILQNTESVSKFEVVLSPIGISTPDFSPSSLSLAIFRELLREDPETPVSRETPQ